MGQTLCNTKQRDKAIVETSLKGVVKSPQCVYSRLFVDGSVYDDGKMLPPPFQTYSADKS
jgi:hypothetical protein